LTAVGVYLLAGISASSDYAADLLPGLVATGLGIGSAFVAISIGTLEGVEERDAGLASGIANTTQQIGGALGVAVLSTVAIERTDSVLASDPATSQAVAVTEGFQLALLVGAGFAVAAAVAAVALVRGRPRPAEASPAALELEQAA
jgi:sugar phosphate permease